MAKKFINPFTEEETKILRSIIYRTWEYIAPDIFTCDEVISMSRNDVIEVTLDAGYIETNLSSSFGRNKEKLEEAKKLVTRFRALSYDDQNSFCKKYVFPFARYS